MSAPFALAALLLLSGACALRGNAQSPSDAPLETRVRSAALFKNGLGFVRREGTIPAGARSVRVEPLPVPVHGTFWIVADPARAKVGPALARRTEVREAIPAVTMEDLLRANIGRPVTLGMGEKEAVQGTLESVTEPPLPSPVDAPERAIYVPPTTGTLALVRTADGSMAIPTLEVRRLRIEGGELVTKVARRREAASLSCAVEGAEGPAPISLLYLERGLTWVPSYAIDLTEAEKATLTAKAEVVNEAEDLEGATLRFVTGYPNLRFAHVADPIAIQENLAAFLTALGRTAPESPLLARQAAVARFEYRADADAAFPVVSGPGPGESAEDLFFYDQKDATLRRGERGLYPLFTVKVPYEHLYEWSIPDTIGENTYPPQPETPREEEIWHSVRLTNDSSLPWTTATAMTMKNGNLLGQDALPYAAVGAKTTVRITRALDVQGEQSELEVARDRGAARFYGNAYDRVTVKGELCATNRKREAVRLEITKRIQGEVTKNPNEAKVVQVAEGLRRVNPNARLTWTIPLEPGQRVTIDYEYRLYVRG